MAYRLLTIAGLHKLVHKFLVKTLRGVLLLTLMVSSRPAHAETDKAESPRYGGTLRLGTYGSPAPLNPFQTTETISMSVMQMIFNSPFRPGTDFNYEPDLVEEFKISGDGKTYDLFIKEGIRFHDGSTCTSKDLINFLKIVKDPKLSPTFAHLFDAVESFTEIDNGIRIVLSRPYSPFLRLLGVAGVLPAKHVPYPAVNMERFSSRPIGTGPFRYEEMTPASIVLKANEDYFEGRPFLDEVNIKVFEKKNDIWTSFLRGDLDVILYMDREDYEEIRNNPSFKTYRSVPTGGWNLVFNFRNPALAKRQVREAVSFSLDRKEMIDLLENGEAIEASGPIHPDSWAYEASDLMPFDPEKAMKLLHEAKAGDLELRLLVAAQNDHFYRLAKVIRQQLSQTGIRVSITPHFNAADLPEMLSRGDFDLYLTTFNVGTDPYFAKRYWGNGERYNHGKFENEEVDELFSAVEKTIDIPERAKIYKQIQKIISREKPAAFLYIPYVYHAVSADLENTDFLKEPFIRFQQFRRIYLKERR